MTVRKILSMEVGGYRSRRLRIEPHQLLGFGNRLGFGLLVLDGVLCLDGSLDAGKILGSSSVVESPLMMVRAGNPLLLVPDLPLSS